MGWCGFDPLPGGRVLRTLVGATDFPNPTGPTNLVPPLSIKLSSARHRRAALSLCYGGMAEPGRIERLALRPLRFSKPLEEPTSAGSNWRKAAGADPQTFRFHSVSNGSPGPPGIAFPLLERGRVAERDQHRTIGQCWSPDATNTGVSNTAEEPTSTRRPHRVSTQDFRLRTRT